LPPALGPGALSTTLLYRVTSQRSRPWFFV
jgi:hypothetical protein